ncbi:hypothetical protein [Paraburkholderia sp. SG-MS1]|nr:hypothetical protein [Paraburkholderia sp. SG-MS1]
MSRRCPTTGTAGADIDALNPQQLQTTARVKAFVDLLVETLSAR